MIIYGHNHFKIKKIYPNELGLIDDFDYHIEIRQKYFHVFWIPFFGLGKIWAIRRNGELYDLPFDYQQEIKKRKIKARSPWYTYSLPLILLFGFAIYSGVENLRENKSRERNIKYYTENVQTLLHNIDNAKTNEFFKLDNTKTINSESATYLKVEKVYPDRILFTVIPGFFLYSSQLELEECYNQNKGNLDTISIAKTKLKNAVNQDYDLSKTGNFKGQNLLNSKYSYALSKIETKFEPKLSISKTFIDYKIIQIELTNSSVGFKVLSLKNISNTIPWSTKLPFEVSAGTHSKPTLFTLGNTENPKFSFYGNNKYSTELKIIDANNIQYTYIISGEGSSNSITRI